MRRSYVLGTSWLGCTGLHVFTSNVTNIQIQRWRRVSIETPATLAPASLTISLEWLEQIIVQHPEYSTDYKAICHYIWNSSTQQCEMFISFYQIGAAVQGPFFLANIYRGSIYGYLLLVLLAKHCWTCGVHNCLYVQVCIHTCQTRIAGHPPLNKRGYNYFLHLWLISEESYE